MWVLLSVGVEIVIKQRGNVNQIVRVRCYVGPQLAKLSPAAI